MFQKKPKHIILNRCRSFSINRKKNAEYVNKNNNNAYPLSDLTNELKYISIENSQSPIRKFNVNKEKSQSNFKKTIKISFNKYHQYMRNLNDINNNFNKRPVSLYVNKKIKNNRGEIGQNYSSMTRNRNIHDIYNLNSFKGRTLFSGNNNYRQNSNMFHIGINSPNNKSNSFNQKKYNSFNNYNSNTINKKFGNLTLNQKLKNSKFFYKTKYINGIKNKNIKKKKGISLSTYNIFLEPSQDEFIYNTINDIIIKQLENDSKINESNKKKEIISNNNDYKIEKAKYFDLLPIILNHIKQKRTMDDVYREYNKYLSNISENTSNNNIINKNNKIKHPIIKYLFLQNILNNLKHLVKFINIQSKEEIEQNVIKVIGEEYSKLEDNNSKIYNKKDFLSYGYEYNPNIINDNYKNFIDKGLQTSKVSYKKSIFFINEKKLEENNYNTNNNNEVISPTRKFFLKNNISERRRIDFDKLKLEQNKKKNVEEEELKNNINNILSNYPLKIEKDNKKQNGEYIKNNDFFKNKDLQNVINTQKKSSNKKKEKENKKLFKPKFIKIKLNKLKINEVIKQNNNNKLLDSTDKMNNMPPSLERYNQKNEQQEEISRKQSASIKKGHKDNKDKKIKITHTTFKNDFLIEKTNKERHSCECKKDSNENKKSIHKDSSREEDKNNNQPLLTKDNDENNKKNSKFTKKYKKALKEKKKLEKLQKKMLENQEIALREIEKHEKKKKKKISVFNELMYNNQRKSIITLFNEKTIKQTEEKNNEEEENYSSLSSSLSNFKKLKEIEKEEKSNENENNNENDNDEKEDVEGSILSSISQITNELEEFNELKEIMKPKTKKEAFDEERRKITYRRRGGIFIPSPEIFKDAIKSKELSDLNEKIKKLYDNIYREKKREEYKRKKKKRYIYNFRGIDLSNIEEVEKRKRVHLARIKEDIKYKINKGKIHYHEFENYMVFERAMNNINLNKLRLDKKRIGDYVHSLEKYFQLFYYELLANERKKKEEERINRFLYELHEEVGVIIPYVKFQKGKRCRSTDYNKEINLSEINSSNNK